MFLKGVFDCKGGKLLVNQVIFNSKFEIERSNWVRFSSTFFCFHGIQFLWSMGKKKNCLKNKETKPFLSFPKIKCFAIHFPTFQSKQIMTIYNYFFCLGSVGCGRVKQNGDM